VNYYDQLELHKNIVLDYFIDDNHGNAIKELEAILKLDKSNEWAIGYLVRVYQKNQDWLRAGKYLVKHQKLTNTSDDHKLALYKIQEGRRLIGENKFQESRQIFEDSLRICNDLAAAYYFIGNAYSAESEVAYQKSSKSKSDMLFEESESTVEIDDASILLGKAIPMWIRYAELKPEHSWIVIHLLKDGLFALDRYSEFEDILKQIIKIDNDNIEVIASLSEILSHRGEEVEAMNLIDSAIEQDPSSLLVKLIKLKHQAKKQQGSTEYMRGLDDIIHFLVTDESFQLYKSTKTDPDIIWLYKNSSYEQNSNI
jgi:tetratricopeptide (TPR) repeat protein